MVVPLLSKVSRHGSRSNRSLPVLVNRRIVVDLYVTDQPSNCSRTKPGFHHSLRAMFLSVKAKGIEPALVAVVVNYVDYNETCDLPNWSMR